MTLYVSNSSSHVWAFSDGLFLVSFVPDYGKFDTSDDNLGGDRVFLTGEGMPLAHSLLSYKAS